MDNDKVHIHKVVQSTNGTYKGVRQKYGDHIDEKGFIPMSVLSTAKFGE